MIEPMMLVKLIHVISSAVLFCGTLSASVFFTLAWRRADAALVQAVAQLCRLAAIITAVAMVVQPVTGLILIKLQEDSPTAPWLIAAYCFYAVALAAWAGATVLLGRFATGPREAVADGRAFRAWAAVSWGSVVVVCCIYYLMLAQPSF